LGVTSISMVGPSYSQNVKGTEDYRRLLAQGQLPIYRGIHLDADDLLRREVITRLICQFELDFAAIEAAHSMVFADYFASELEELAPMEADGLLRLERDTLRVNPAGRLLIRNICMVFDKYLRDKAGQRFSKVI